MGEVFGGRYELVDVLASGGAGTVWRAWDHRDSVYRAAKVLRQSDSDSLLRFIRETTQKVDHPHVVAPYGWSGEDDRILFTMPLVRGGSVHTLLRDLGTLPAGWAVELTRQSLRALVEVHGLGLVHRDVKPANLLLEATGPGHPHLMLSDFGAAARIDAPRLTHVDSVIGTPGYLAPEQRRGADPAVAQDLYAVGVVLLEMLTGVRPSADGVLPPAPRFDTASAALADLASRLTSPLPGNRPADARSALAELDALPGAHDLRRGSDPDDPVEILDHVPDLPVGWSTRGPEGADDRLTPPQARPAVRRTAEPTVVLPRSSTRSSAPSCRRVPRLAIALAVLGVVLLLLAVLVG